MGTASPGGPGTVGELLSSQVVTVGPTHSLGEAARRMWAHGVGAAVVLTDDEGPGIISERDVMRAVAQGEDLQRATVADYMTWNAVVATPSWDLETAARTMLRHGFRHLVVVEGSEVVGVLSMRELMAGLAATGASARA